MIPPARHLFVFTALAGALSACAPGATSSSGLPCNDDDECGLVERCVLGACSYTGRPGTPRVTPVEEERVEDGGAISDDAGAFFDDAGAISDDAGAISDDAGAFFDDAGVSFDDAGPVEEADGGGEPDAGPSILCGNDLVDEGEDCDDGNTVDDGNGCSADCKKSAVCGNGVIEELYESCDPGAEACCADDCGGPAASGTVCRDADYACDEAERCDGASSVCPPDEGLADGESCAECDSDVCSCSEGECVEVDSVPPLDDAYLGTNSPFPYDPSASTCHEHGGSGDGRFTVGTWQDGEEVRGVIEFLLPSFGVERAELRFEVGSFPGMEDQEGPGDFEIVVHNIEANGAAGISDCARDSLAEVMKFSTDGLMPGQVLKVDVTHLLTSSLGFVGFRFEPVTDPGYHVGVTFEAFSIEYLNP